MKTLICLVAFTCASLPFFSCKKSHEVSLESDQRAEQFRATITSKKFQLRSFYSDKPIDYIETDSEVRAETDLNRYVSPWITDDWNVFDVGKSVVTITQNARKIHDDQSDIINRSFSISSEASGVYFNFLDYRYNPLQYRLLEFTETHFIVYVDWKNGARLFTEFGLIEGE